VNRKHASGPDEGRDLFWAICILSHPYFTAGVAAAVTDLLVYRILIAIRIPEHFGRDVSPALAVGAAVAVSLGLYAHLYRRLETRLPGGKMPWELVSSEAISVGREAIASIVMSVCVLAAILWIWAHGV
jgi:hypothetical protein